MAQDPKILLEKLKELINNSPSINSLPEAQKKETVNRMLSSKPYQMEELIKILEEESKKMAKIDEEERKKIDEVEGLLKEVEATEKQLRRELNKEAEKKASVREKSEQEKLLEELDQA